MFPTAMFNEPYLNIAEAITDGVVDVSKKAIREAIIEAIQLHGDQPQSA